MDSWRLWEARAHVGSGLVSTESLREQGPASPPGSAPTHRLWQLLPSHGNREDEQERCAKHSKHVKAFLP